MLSKERLPEIGTTELLLLQKHIQLGKEHLGKLLTEKEMEQIFQLAAMTPRVRNKLSTSKTELAGTITLVINTQVLINLR